MSDHYDHLMSLPVHSPTRPLLSQLIRKSDEALARAVRRFLTLASEYAKRAAFDRRRHEPELPHDVYLKRIAARLVTIQRVHPIAIPGCDPNDVQRYVTEFDNLNNLRHVNGSETSTDSIRRFERVVGAAVRVF